MCPVGAGGLLEAEKSTGLLVDSLLALKGVSDVLHILLVDATWEGKEDSKRAFSSENPD